MISSWFFASSSPLVIFLLLCISPSPNSHFAICTAQPAGVEAILELDPLGPLGDLVQVAPNLALHQQEAEKAQSLVKSIKTPSGTVKCSCQTVPEEGDDGDDPSHDHFPSDPTKTIEIEIYQHAEDENKQEGDVDFEGENDKIQSEGQAAKNSEQEGESQVESSEKNNNNKPQALPRNSFTLDDNGDDASVQLATEENAAAFASSSQDRVFSTEEPSSFLAFLSSLVSSSAQAEALSSSQSQQQLRSSEPEKIETEAKLESEQDYGDNDDLASSSEDVNMANHRMFDTVTTSMPVVPPPPLPSAESSANTVYKSFRTSDLIGPRPVLPTTTFDGEGSSGSSSEKMDSVVGANNPREDFFLWDFIYAADRVGKKKELLQLGTMTDPFKGPRRRRRRRRRRSLRGNGNDSPVVFVYPVGHNNVDPMTPSAENPSNNNKVVIPENKTRLELTPPKIQMRSDTDDELENRDQVHRAMQAAMDRAWQQYGPKGLDAPPVTPAPPSPVYIIPASQQPPDPPLPKESGTQGKNRPPQLQKSQQTRPPLLPQQSQQQELVYYSPPRPFLFIDRIFNPFQPMTSEWDQHVTTSFQGPPPRPPEPGLFSRFLARYIDFEVNNHEAADLMRKVVFGIFVGFLIVGWIALGAALGIVPFKKLLSFVAGSHYDVATKRIDKGKEFSLRDTTLAELTDKISLSLDGDWLKKLEERVMGNNEHDGVGGGGIGKLKMKIPTKVFCCILPDEQTEGIVECQVQKSGPPPPAGTKKVLSVFKCISNLIYNFQFGPKDVGNKGNLDLDIDKDNAVIKSKSVQEELDDEEDEEDEEEK